MRQMYNSFHFSQDYAELYAMNQYLSYSGVTNTLTVLTVLQFFTFSPPQDLLCCQSIIVPGSVTEKNLEIAKSVECMVGRNILVCSNKCDVTWMEISFSRSQGSDCIFTLICLILDVLTANKYLRNRTDLVDPNRIGIYGLSYGGLNCLQVMKDKRLCCDIYDISSRKKKRP